MKRFKFFSVVMVAMAAIMLTACDSDSNPVNNNEPDGNAKVRVIHTSYDAPAVDIWVDGSVAIANLAYGETSGYAEVPAGTRNIQVSPTGATSPIVIDVDLTLEQDKEYTVYAVNELANIGAIVSEDARSANSSKAKVRLVHTAPDAPAVDVKLNSGSGPAVFTNVPFEQFTDYIEVDAGTYTFVVTPTGSDTEVVVFDPITVTNGSVYTVVAHGTLTDTNYPFAVRVFVDNNAGDAFVDLTTDARANVMVIHASPDAPGVDLLLDDAVVNSAALEFPANTGYLEVNPGTRNIKVNASGTSQTVIEADLVFTADQNYSIFAVDVLSKITPLVFEDDLTAPAAGKAHVRFIHLSPDAPAVDITLTDGSVVFGNYEFKQATDFTPLDAATYNLQVRLAGTSTVVLDLPGIVLEDGKIYTVFAKGLVSGAGNKALGAEIIAN
ncbi:MAG: DUF4397 domain-containing protein [Calditrichae bacterium]|nr:DUF4397 domain-containing protein [Calditrichia bacterium]